eukprot:11786134-Ditylum_brightwellii.AAC.1
MKGKNCKKVTIISAYQVYKNNIKDAGSTTCWMQQWQALQENGHDDPDPQDEFMKDFDTFVKKRMEKGEEHIIDTDANEHNTATSDIGKFICKHDLIDTTEHLHGEFTPPSTYQYGQHQIGYILVTPGILPALTAT